jgi:hypothetical protein
MFESNLGVGNYDLPERVLDRPARAAFPHAGSRRPVPLFINTRGGLVVSSSDDRRPPRRPFASTTRSPRVARRSPAAGTRRRSTAVGPRLCPRQTLFRMGVLTRRVDNSNDFELSDIHVASQAALTPAPPRPSRGALAIRTSVTSTCRSASTCRTISGAQEPDVEPGHSLRGADAPADYNNVGPRFGVTWAPFKSGKTSPA